MSTAPTGVEQDVGDTDQGITPLEVAKQLETMGYEFVGPRFVIMRDPMDTKIGMLYLPQSGQREKRSGVIVAVGTGVEADASEHPVAADLLARVYPGQKTLFAKYEAVQLDLKLLEKTIRLDFVHWRDLYVTAPPNKADLDGWNRFNSPEDY